MPHTLKTSKGEMTISSRRLARQADRMFGWLPDKIEEAIRAAETRLDGRHPHKHDVATILAAMRSQDV